MSRISLLPHRAPPWFIDPLVAVLRRSGLSPNQLTALGFLGNVGAAVLLGFGQFLAGGVVVLLAGGVDLLDGALARATGRASPFGAVFDAVMDRLSEGAVLFGLLLFYLLEGGHRQEVVLLYAALVGSFLVSYVRARAAAEGIDIREGLFTRAERVILLSIALILNQVLVALWILAVLANGTALQRLYAVWRKTGQGRPAHTPELTRKDGPKGDAR